MFKIIALCFLTLDYLSSVTADVPPMLSLSGPYNNEVVHLPNFVCVKGNNARSITFQMKTKVTDEVIDLDQWPPIIGK